jgi:hypothetical protein
MCHTSTVTPGLLMRAPGYAGAYVRGHCNLDAMWGKRHWSCTADAVTGVVAWIWA